MNLQTMFDLRGRTALVTGASQGLGYVLARGLGRAGARIVLNGRDKPKLDAAVGNLREDGVDAIAAAFDVTSGEQVNQAMADLSERGHAIDILVNNAGIQRRALLEDMDEETFRQVIDGNLTSAFLVTRAVVHGMIARKQGKIINICSLMSKLGRPSTGNYAAAKGGLRMLTRAMATEWARHGIQVNGIGPGYFITDMTKSLAEDVAFDAWIKQRTPAGRWGNPEELVGAAIFLASEAASYVNGQILYVDGGLSAAI
jgi:gluconate 5-dehydrogenase